MARRLSCIVGAHVVLSMVSGCTSISWQDSSGRTHHLGLVAGRVVELPRGASVQRWAVGADLRVAGSDRGYTLGYASLVVTSPERRAPSSEDELVEEVLAEYEDPRADAPSAGPLKLFYFVEPVSAGATLARSSALGLGARVGPLSPGFTVGWQSSARVLGEALTADVVQVHWFRESSSAVSSAALWRLPAPSSSPEVGPEESR